MTLLKTAFGVLFIVAPVVLSMAWKIDCHEPGVDTLGQVMDVTTDNGDKWDQVAKSNTGYIFVSVISKNDATHEQGDTNGCTRRLRINTPNPPLVDCCHNVELKGRSTIQLLLQVTNPAVNNTSFAEIGDGNNRTYTRWIGTTDNCLSGTWTRTQTLEFWGRLQYTSTGGAAPTRSVTGEWRHNVDQSVGPPIALVDNGAPDGQVTGSREETFNQLPQYTKNCALEVANSSLGGTAKLVRTDAPPTVPGSGLLGLARSTWSVLINQHFLKCMEPGCVAETGF